MYCNCFMSCLNGPIIFLLNVHNQTLVATFENASSVSWNSSFANELQLSSKACFILCLCIMVIFNDLRSLILAYHQQPPHKDKQHLTCQVMQSLDLTVSPKPDLRSLTSCITMHQTLTSHYDKSDRICTPRSEAILEIKGCSFSHQKNREEALDYCWIRGLLSFIFAFAKIRINQ